MMRAGTTCVLAKAPRSIATMCCCPGWSLAGPHRVMDRVAINIAVVGTRMGSVLVICMRAVAPR
jgi:hypothetical protein